MAALAEPFSGIPQLAVRDLRDYRASHLEAVLQAEEREWLATLNWDFRNSAELVRRFVDMGSLNGSVLVDGGSLRGYSYFLMEDGKGLLGDLYVVEPYRTPQSEDLLLAAVMDQLIDAPRVSRMEAQILMLSAPLKKADARWTRQETFRREFLEIALPAAAMDARTLPPYLAIEPWTSACQEQAAHLIPIAYRGHVDARINDQYRSVNGARKFLTNIVQFPGCGEFHPAASMAAFDMRDGRMCGMVLSSMVAQGSGHITQVCVEPSFQGLGLGRVFLQRALGVLQQEGCRTVSLTVTKENGGALRLYQRMGFRSVKQFNANVWER